MSSGMQRYMMESKLNLAVGEQCGSYTGTGVLSTAVGKSEAARGEVHLNSGGQRAVEYSNTDWSREASKKGRRKHNIDSNFLFFQNSFSVYPHFMGKVEEWLSKRTNWISAINQ